MTVRFNVKDLRENGLEIISPVDPSFDALISSQFNNKPSRQLEEMKPFSVFVKNTSNRSLVAYVLKWEITRANGRPTTTFSSYGQPGVLLGYGVNFPDVPGATVIIASGSARLFSLSSQIDPDGAPGMGGVAFGSKSTDGLDPSVKPLERAKTELRKTTNITVSLDAAMFADGTFVGPNTSRYYERLKAEIDAKKDLLARIASAQNTPAGLDRAFESLQAPGSDEPQPSYLNSSTETLYRYYSRMYAREMLDLKAAYGKEKAAAHFRGLHNARKPTLTKVSPN